MSERSTAKASKNSSAKPARKASAGGAPVNELDVLRRELELAKAEIAELQRRQTEAATRIDWLIDSLHNLGD
jgi:hypothetical protein